MAPLPLVGRVAEVARLEHHLAGAGPPVLLLAGEPGIGKSRLLQEAATRAVATGWTVITGGCHRRSGQEPFTPFAEMLARFLTARAPAQQRQDLSGCSWLTRLLPELLETAVVPSPTSASTPTYSLPPEQERRLMFAAVARLLANVAGPSGTLLILDDLQWSAPDALDLLAFLLRELPASARLLRVIGAFRDTDVVPGDPLALQLVDLAREGTAVQVHLAPLGPGDSAELLTALLADAVDTPLVAATAPEALQQVLDQSGGVPFFLVSYAQELRAGFQGFTGVKDGEARNTAVPRTVADSIRARVGLLSEAAQLLLALGAVAGRQTHHRALREAAKRAGLSDAESLAALSATSRAQLLCPAAGDCYAFPHDLIRDVVVGDLGVARLAALHRTIGEALEQLERQPERRAAELTWHFAEGDAPERALPYALQAGVRAQANYAFAQAEGSFRLTMRLADALGETAAKAQAGLSLGIVLSSQMRLPEALEVLGLAVTSFRATNDPAGVVRAGFAQAVIYGRIGRVTEALAAAEPLVHELAGAPCPPDAMSKLWAILGMAYNEVGRYREAGEAMRQAVQIARAAHDVVEFERASAIQAECLLRLGRLDEATQILEASLEDSEGESHHDTVVHSYRLFVRALTRRDAGAFAAAYDLYTQAIGMVAQIGHAHNLAGYLAERAALSFDCGRWSDAQADLARATELGAGLSVAGRQLSVARLRGTLCLAAGEREEGQRTLERVIATAGSVGELGNVRLGEATLAELDLLDGAPRSARERLTSHVDRPGVEEREVTALLPILGWALLEVGALEDAETVVEQATRRARRHLRLVLPDALRVAALLAIRRRGWQAAQNALDEAISLAKRMPLPWGEAKTHFVYGQLHSAKGDPARARAAYEAALVMCQRLGEGLYRPHIERELASLDGG